MIEYIKNNKERINSEIEKYKGGFNYYPELNEDNFIEKLTSELLQRRI